MMLALCLLLLLGLALGATFVRRGIKMTKDEACTDWFPCTIEPVRPGYYECLYTFGNRTEARMRFWNGQMWSLNRHGGRALFGRPRDQWRGLKQQTSY